MDKGFERYRGIHPGAVIERELKKRQLAQRPFALSLPEHPQTFNALLKGKRNLNASLALRIEKAFGLEEGTLLILQCFYDIEREKKKMAQMHKPDLSRIRRTLFWDTNLNAINWEKQSRPVIKRIFERGNLAEKREITRFYGIAKIREAIKPSPGLRQGSDLTTAT